jgi:preprotein translocase subunit YajC
MAGTMAEPQSFTNHTRRDPKYLVFAPLALICFVMSIVHVIHEHSRANILLVPVGLLVFLAIALTRMYALQNQNRIIRLEESLRIMTLGGSAAGVTPSQSIALRFASDEEFVALARRAVAENMEPKAIKASIKNWRADNDRI